MSGAWKSNSKKLLKTWSSTTCPLSAKRTTRSAHSASEASARQSSTNGRRKCSQIASLTRSRPWSGAKRLSCRKIRAKWACMKWDQKLRRAHQPDLWMRRRRDQFRAKTASGPTQRRPLLRQRTRSINRRSACGRYRSANTIQVSANRPKARSRIWEISRRWARPSSSRSVRIDTRCPKYSSTRWTVGQTAAKTWLSGVHQLTNCCRAPVPPCQRWSTNYQARVRRQAGRWPDAKAWRRWARIYKSISRGWRQPNWAILLKIIKLSGQQMNAFTPISALQLNRWTKNHRISGIWQRQSRAHVSST